MLRLVEKPTKANEALRTTLDELLQRGALAELYERQHSRRVLNSKQRHPPPPDIEAIGPSELLQAKYAVVPFHDTGIQKAIVAWALADGAAVSGRLVFGPGGVGKTRVMAELAPHLRVHHG